jgi:hypothetical protein
VHPQELTYRERDADNRLWWRAERRRLDAEQLRDSLLTASAQLDLRMGGPSFRPVINPEALEGLSRKGGAWQASPHHEQRRRAVYVYTQRSLLPPLMTTFDFSDTTLPCGRRDVTVVAPQALALLNNPFVHEQSEQLADRVHANTADNQEAAVELAWKLALGRSPSTTEREAAQEYLVAQRAALQNAGGGVDPEFLALKSLCHVLLNSNEFIYVD